jgi:hypothetical protein
LATLSDFEEGKVGKRQGKREGKVGKREGKKTHKREEKNDFEGDISDLISGNLLQPEINILCETLDINTKNPIAFLVSKFLEEQEDEKTLELRQNIQHRVAMEHLIKTRGYVDFSLLYGRSGYNNTLDFQTVRLQRLKRWFS